MSTESTADHVEPSTTAADAVGPFVLEVFPETLVVTKLGAGADVPAWAESSSIFAILATAGETTLVSAKRSVPAKVPQSGAMRAFAVQGPLDFALTGVLHALLAPLAEARISVFTLSTFSTDWILVPVGKVEEAAELWRQSGHTVVPASAEN